MKGNVLDLAVAVVMGTAFTAIVTSITKGLLEPLLAVLGGNSEFGFGVQLMAGKPSTFIALGPIITACINFVTVAAVLYFVLILPMKTLQARLVKPTAVKADPTELELLTEIRDLLARQHIADIQARAETSGIGKPDDAVPGNSQAIRPNNAANQRTGA
ncbi:large conductance mechanosensitive channel protein MscL [Nocardia jejuensis]|uniref:large conductance mechanosensitive channel protein MscL n=1 Tax=Nocardia jejuensis TaxID=328049 RepID=UPI003BB67D0A